MVAESLGSRPGFNETTMTQAANGDVVALNPLDSTFFNVRPEIFNFKGVKNHTDNQHGIVGYLNDPTVAKHIYSEVP